MKRYRLLIPLLVLSSVLALPQPCAACSCIMQTPDEAIAHATTIFRGRVTAITPGPGPRSVTVAMTADTSWKGTVNRETSLVTDPDTASCGYPFEVGEEYLVFARGGQSGGLSTSSCSATQSTAGPQRHVLPVSGFLALLGSGAPAIEAPPPAMPAAGIGGVAGSGLGWLVVIAAAALIGVGLFFGRRRREGVAR